MMVRALSRLGLAVVLVAPAGCASTSRDAGWTRPPVSQTPTRTVVLDRDRALIAGLATSLALGVVGLGTMLASGIYADPVQNSESQSIPTMTLIGGIMTAGFLAAVPLAVAVERHRARHPEYFSRGGRHARLAPPLTLVPAPALPARARGL